MRNRGRRGIVAVGALVLAACLAPPVSGQAPRLFYEADGGGPPIVFVADWAHDTGSWFRVLPRLRPDGWRLVRYDLRGQGRSEAPADGDYSLAAHRGDLLRLLDGLDIRSAHLVGCGLGADVALDFAHAHPDRALSVTAIDPRLEWAEAERAPWDRLLAAWERVGRPSLGEYTSVLVERWLGTDYVERDPWVVPWYDLALRRQDAGALTASLRAWLDATLDLEGGLGDVPVLIVVGERWEGARSGRAVLGDALPRAWRERIDDSGAQPEIDAPAELSARIREFLERVGG